jgi:hypothetical protein
MTTVPAEVRQGPGRPRPVNRDEAIVAVAKSQDEFCADV